MPKKKKKQRKKSNSNSSRKPNLQIISSPNLDTLASNKTDAFKSIEKIGFENNLLLKNSTHESDLSPLFKANEYIDQAYLTEDPKEKVALAKKALFQSLHCVDAYCLLGKYEAKTPEEALVHLNQGYLVAKRQLEKDNSFEEDEGIFWGVFETRPYMRIRYELGATLHTLGKKEEAIEHFKDLIRLNKNDNQGVRYVLINWLIESKNTPDAMKLWQDFSDDSSASWMFSKALLDFIEHGDNQISRKSLIKATNSNSHIINYFTNLGPIPKSLPLTYSDGSKEEALLYLFHSYEAWLNTSNSIEWLIDTCLSDSDKEYFTKKELVFSLIKEMKLDDLYLLNKHICNQLDQAEVDEMIKTKRIFSKGEDVCIKTADGRKIFGQIEKFNKKSVRVFAKEENKVFTTHPSLLQKI